MEKRTTNIQIHDRSQGWIQDFKLGGVVENNRAERSEAGKYLGYFVWKITILRKQIIFFQILGGGGRRVTRRPPGSAPGSLSWLGGSVKLAWLSLRVSLTFLYGPNVRLKENEKLCIFNTNIFLKCVYSLPVYTRDMLHFNMYTNALFYFTKTQPYIL